MVGGDVFDDGWAVNVDLTISGRRMHFESWFQTVHGTFPNLA